MSLLQRFERRLEGLVAGGFARVFKGQVEPVEIGQALQREAADKRHVVGGDAGDGRARVMSPNRYRVTLSPSDFERLEPWQVQLSNSLAELVQDHLDENGWDTIGDIEVYLARDDDLHTGVFGVASRMESAAPPRRRPHDSLSMPIVQPGSAPDAYPQQYAQPAGAPVPPFAQPQYPPAPFAPPQVPQPQVPQPQVPQPQVAQPQFAPPYGQPPFAQPEFPQPQFAGQYAPAPPQFPDAPRFAGHPQPAYSTAAALVVDQSGKRFDLRPGSNVLGRGSDSDFQLLDQGISRRHLDVHFDGRTATAHDLGSTNGTTVNGHEITSQQLRHGDVIRVGHTRIVFQQGAG